MKIDMDEYELRALARWHTHPDRENELSLSPDGSFRRYEVHVARANYLLSTADLMRAHREEKEGQ